MLKSINPFTGKAISSFKIDSAKAINEKLSKTESVIPKWKNLSIQKRSAYLKKLAGYLKKEKAALAKIATEEMGKPITQSIAEVEKCALALEYYAKNAEQFLQAEDVKTEAQRSFVAFEPLGTVLAIMPWNFPYWQVVRAMAPILCSGNTMVLKHASNVYGCALALKKATEKVGFPEGVFELLQITSKNIEKIISDPRIHAVTFTGSTEAGKKVAALAAAHLKKQVLELGGSDPYVILSDADLNIAVEACTNSRLNNIGQSCIAAKRFIVHKKIIKAFTEKMQESFASRSFGDPMDYSTTVGTMARMDLRDELHQQVEKSVRQGAKILCGGILPEGKAAFYPPTILTDVRKGMPAFDEELFGPVAAIIAAESTEEAILLANQSIFGLGAAIFSKNTKKATELAQKELQAGSVFVNEFVRSDPRLPFGGIKESGYGRELSYYAIREFVNIKTIYVK